MAPEKRGTEPGRTGKSDRQYSDEFHSRRHSFRQPVNRVEQKQRTRRDQNSLAPNTENAFHQSQQPGERQGLR